MSFTVPWKYVCGFISVQYIRDAIIVMSIRVSTFYRIGYFMLKLLVLLKVTTLGGGPWASFTRSSVSSMDTLAESKVSTLDWYIRKSEVSTLTRMLGICSLTQIEFLSEEHQTLNSRSHLGLLSSALPSTLICPISSSKGFFSFSLMANRKVTLQLWSLIFLISRHLSGLISLKKASRLQSISFSLSLRTSGDPFIFFFSWLNSVNKSKSLFLAALKTAILAGSDFMKSKIEQFLTLYSIECTQKRSVCSMAAKRAAWFSFNSESSRLAICFMNVLYISSCSCSVFDSRGVLSSSQNLFIDLSMCSSMFWYSSQLWRSSIGWSSILQKTTTLNFFYPFDGISSILMSYHSTTGDLPKFEHVQRKQPSSMNS